VSEDGRLPPGPNVGTQLAALRRARARAQRQAIAAEDGSLTLATGDSPGPPAGAPRPAARTRARRSANPTASANPKANAIASDADGWFAARGWPVFDFQRAVWSHLAAGRSGLLHATTGAGKTLAAWFGALAVCRAEPASPGGGPRVLWITPMRALAADTTLALQAAADGIAATRRRPTRRASARPGRRPW
jgi:ATP-dependent Lhr-like helicase